MRRLNSTTQRRLDRRKSVNSIQSVHLEHIAPETAERDAQVAASQAFTRARERSVTDSNSPLWPRPRAAGPAGSMSVYNPPTTMSSAEEATLLRQQSIRFVQHDPQYSTINHTMARDISPCISPSRASHVLKQQAADVAEVNTRPSSSASASGMVSATKGAAGEYTNTFFTRDEYYTPEDGIASMPSSYRRLRKSNSMFSNLAAGMVPAQMEQSKTSVPANQVHNSADTNAQSSIHDNNPPRSGLKTSRSTSFLRDLRGNFPPIFKSEDNSAARLSTVGHHKDQNGGRATLRSKSSKFFRPKSSSQVRVFRKTMRDTDDNSVPANLKPSNEGSLRFKARKVSQGFKSKLKSLFGVGKGENDDTVFPEQHIEAKRSYPFQSDDALQETDEELLYASASEAPPLSQVNSGVASLHTVPQSQHLRSQKGSIESLKSEQDASDERSRVTSWSNSDASAANTLNSCREERERKRLSIINENGAHVCSASSNFASVSEQSTASTTSLDRPVSQAPRVPVDGRRIYSALMKRKEHLETQNDDLDANCDAESFVQLGTVPRRKSSLRRQPLNYDTEATIRRVMPESGSGSASVKAGAKLAIRDRRRLATEVSTPFLSTPNDAKEEIMENRNFGAIYADNQRDVPPNDMDNGLPASPETGTRPALVPTVTSRSSAFFGSPTRHLFRTESPYRRALQDRMKTNTNEHAIASLDLNPWKGSFSSIPNLPIPSSSYYGSDADIRLNYTESIYSTNAEDVPIKKHNVLSADENQPKSTHGDVTIFVNSPDFSKQSSSMPPRPRVLSSSSLRSEEWQTFISSKMTKLEESTACIDTTDFQCGLSPTKPGHLREYAQINDEEEDRKPITGSSAPSRVRPDEVEHRDASGFLNLDSSDEDEDQGVDDDLPVTFDAGESRPLLRRQLPTASSLSAGTSKSNIVSPGTPTNAMGHKPSTRLADMDKALTKVPSRTFRESITNTNITTRLTNRHQNTKPSISTLANCTPSGDHSGKASRLGDSQQKVAGIMSAKIENVIPAAVDSDDPYGADGAGILGPNQHGGVGSKRMVDVFLSSRRQRMASSDDGNVFL